MAPELFTESHKHGPEADLWSLGITLLELLTGHRPFDDGIPGIIVAYVELETYLRSNSSLPQAVESSRVDDARLTGRTYLSSTVDPEGRAVSVRFRRPPKLAVFLRVPLPPAGPSLTSSLRDLLSSLLDIRSWERLAPPMTRYRRDPSECVVGLPFVVDKFDHISPSIRPPFQPDVLRLRKECVTRQAAMAPEAGDVARLSTTQQLLFKDFHYNSPTEASAGEFAPYVVR